MAHAMTFRPVKLVAMKATEFWFWKMRDDWGRVRRSVCRFTEAEALARDHLAQRIGGTCEVRMCPETVDEIAALALDNGPLMRAGKS